MKIYKLFFLLFYLFIISGCINAKMKLPNRETGKYEAITMSASTFTEKEKVDLDKEDSSETIVPLIKKDLQ